MSRSSMLVATLLLALAAAPAAAQAPPDPARERLVDQVKFEVTWAPIALHGLELGLTEAALARGAREMNPLMRGSSGRRLAMKVAMVGAQVTVMRRLAERSPMAARVANWAFCGVLAGIAANNAIALARQR